MSEFAKITTFEEFRLSHGETLRRQREHLRDDAVAQEVLSAGGGLRGWPEWPNVVPVQS